MLGYHEMPRVSEKIEQNMKGVFAGHLDPAYPRVIVARRVLRDTYSPTETPFFEYDTRYPETVTEEDQSAYDQGINALNEWATNYATDYYIEHTNKTPLTKPLRKAYAKIADALTGMMYPHQIYKSMAEVSKFAHAAGQDFNHAVFSGLFHHDFTALNALISQTDTLKTTNLDELAIALGKETAKASETSKKPFSHLVEATADGAIHSRIPPSPEPAFRKTVRRVGESIIVGGTFSIPGLAEVNTAAPLGGTVATAALTTALESAVNHSDVRTALIAGGLGASAAFITAATVFPYLTIHEAVHAYSASDAYVGFIPQQLCRPETDD